MAQNNPNQQGYPAGYPQNAQNPSVQPAYPGTYNGYNQGYSSGQGGYNQGGYQPGQNGYNQSGYQNGGYQNGGYGGYNGGAAYNNGQGGYNPGQNGAYNNGGQATYGADLVGGGGGVQVSALKPLKTNRSLLKLILLGAITFGIYDIVVYCVLSEDINTVATRYDGKRTSHYLVACLLSVLTFGIYGLVWNHQISARIGGELARRRINYNFDSSTFWLWGILGSLLFGFGPLVYTHKLLKAMNLLCDNYNKTGW